MFLSLVRPDRILSPITRSAATALGVGALSVVIITYKGCDSLTQTWGGDLKPGECLSLIVAALAGGSRPSRECTYPQAVSGKHPKGVDRRASSPWAIVGVKIVRWVRHWDEKRQPIIILINFLVLNRARLRCVKLGLLLGEGFADENLVPTVPQRMSLIFEHRKISTERFTRSTDFRLNFVLCIECCDSSSIYLSHIYGHGLLTPLCP